MSIAAQLKVLVVDDMTTSRMLVIEALQQIGIRQINYAKDGQDAIKQLTTTPAHLIISDFEMPGLDGIGLLQTVRNCAATRNTPFIMVTGRTDRAVLERAKTFGLNNYITKPFTVATMKSALQAVFKGL